MDGLDALDLNDDEVFYEQVNSIAEVESLSFVNQGQTDLRVHVEAASAELARQADVVGALQQARTQDGMHFHRGTDNGGGDFIDSESRDDGWASHFFIFITLLQAWL
jgi:hypothetical protein